MRELKATQTPNTKMQKEEEKIPKDRTQKKRKT